VVKALSGCLSYEQGRSAHVLAKGRIGGGPGKLGRFSGALVIVRDLKRLRRPALLVAHPNYDQPDSGDQGDNAKDWRYGNSARLLVGYQ
jgi:hypothetical protein